MTTTYDRIDQSIRTWTHEPEKARGEPSVTAVSEGDGAVLSAAGFSWRADLSEALGGSNAAPSPTHMFLGSLAGCAVLLIKDTLAPQLRIPVDRIEATARCQTDSRGLVGIDGADPGFQRVSIDVQIDSPSGQAAVDQLSAIWSERCPIVLTVTRPTELTITFHAV